MLNTPLDENINMNAFLTQIEKNLSQNDYVKMPKISNHILELYQTNGKIIGIRINNQKIYLSEAWEDDSNPKYILKVNEYLVFEHNKFLHDSFSFDFRGNQNESIIKMFRIDYKSSGDFSGVHAHDYNYQQTNQHLLYPHDIHLEIHYADLNSILCILQKYIEHPDQYPLTQEDDSIVEMYNKILRNERAHYDERI